MDIETQLEFLETELAECEVRRQHLQAIKDTLTDKIAPIVASLDAIIVENESLKLQAQPTPIIE